MTDPQTPSIHRQRRGYYVLWVGLLLASLAAYAAWQVPARVERPAVALALEFRGMPEGMEVAVWRGAQAAWPAGAWDGSGAAFTGRPDAEGRLEVPPVEVPFAVRRWIRKDFIRPRSADLLVLRCTAPGQPPRYLHLDLRNDWYQGLLKDGKRLLYRLTVPWQALERGAELPVEGA
jgi:hypothetical protein